MQPVTKTYIKFIDFKDFRLWDVKRYYKQYDLQFDNQVTLQDILTPYKKNVSKEEMIKNKWQIISKVTQQGVLFLRDFEEIHTYKGGLKLVPDNAIIYSKIGARYGSIYYHEKGKNPFGVSSEYPAYTFDDTRISGMFLNRLLRSEAFLKLLEQKTTGITRSRVREDEFLSLQIPLPPLSEQEKIIQKYFEKINQAKELEKEAQNIEQEIEEYFLAELGIEKTEKRKRKKDLQFVEFKDLKRWDGIKELKLNSHFKVENIGKYITTISTGTTPPTNKQEYFNNGNINFYTPSDIGHLMYLTKAERKITELAIKDKKARVFQKGTLLFVGIGSTVGKIGIIADEYATSNQQITGFMVNQQFLLKEYVYYYFDCFKQITTKEQTKATLPIVNQNKILNIPIPLPPIAKQQEIVNVIQTKKEHLQNLKNQAKALKHQVETEFEQTVFM